MLGDDAQQTASSANRATWRIGLMGGTREEGRWRVPARLRIVTAIGGVKLDLREAELAVADPELTTVSLIGGVSLVVPAGMRVDVGGVRVLGGHDIKLELAAEQTSLLRVRSYGIFGGVKVRTAD